MAKIIFRTCSNVPPGTAERNIAYNKALGFSMVERAERHFLPLAVVGGGRSILQHEATLKSWGGDIWAINGAYGWCKERGIKATFFAIDAADGLEQFACGVESALIGSAVSPKVTDRLKGARVSLFDVGVDGIMCGPTTATTAPCLSLFMGYQDTTFFGCESSWDGSAHAYSRAVDPDLIDNRLLVACNGGEYLTCSEYLMQAECLAAAIRTAPHVFKEESGGLLRALVADPEWDCIKATQHVHDSLVRA